MHFAKNPKEKSKKVMKGQVPPGKKAKEYCREEPDIEKTVMV